jgi:hypothetical protein
LAPPKLESLVWGEFSRGESFFGRVSPGGRGPAPVSTQASDRVSRARERCLTAHCSVRTAQRQDPCSLRELRVAGDSAIHRDGLHFKRAPAARPAQEIGLPRQSTRSQMSRGLLAQTCSQNLRRETGWQRDTALG